MTFSTTSVHLEKKQNKQKKNISTTIREPYVKSVLLFFTLSGRICRKMNECPTRMTSCSGFRLPVTWLRALLPCCRHRLNPRLASVHSKSMRETERGHFCWGGNALHWSEKEPIVLYRFSCCVWGCGIVRPFSLPKAKTEFSPKLTSVGRLNIYDSHLYFVYSPQFPPRLNPPCHPSLPLAALFIPPLLSHISLSSPAPDLHP